MKALRVLLVDDETLARARLRTLLGDCTAPAAEVAAEASTAAEALALLPTQPFDLLLLDIHMPGMDGVQLAQQLRAQGGGPAVVFVTAHAGHALQAFDLEALDYLTKPVRLQRLQQALQKVERSAQVRTAPEPDLAEESLVIHDRGRTERVPLSGVLYLKAELKYITVRTATKHFILDGALGELEQRFASVFIRIHRNALVSRRALRALEKHFDPEEGEGWAVRLHGLDEPLMVSRRQLAAVREAMAG
ncbi:MAG: LytTR family DNA-binding domain-containing protein [Rhodoferax sp.]|uniref:LytR/AlgR family response regulator transcription factor n=1 Tax=Rhodoferax sp. TaxID=50421 RepID=UPI003263601B